MLYTLYEAGYYASAPLRYAARATRDFWRSPLNPASDTGLGRRIFAGAFVSKTRKQSGLRAAAALNFPPKLRKLATGVWVQLVSLCLN